MKKSLFILFVATTLLTNYLFGQSVSKLNEVAWESKITFGTISSKEKFEGSFVVKNLSGGPLVVYNVQTSSGAIVPSWTKTPIALGLSMDINIDIITAGRSGYLEKIISVQTNKGNFNVTIFGTIE
jgi:Protein of unknown function (DUF1573)